MIGVVLGLSVEIVVWMIVNVVIVVIASGKGHSSSSTMSCFNSKTFVFTPKDFKFSSHRLVVLLHILYEVDRYWREKARL